MNICVYIHCRNFVTFYDRSFVLKSTMNSCRRVWFFVEVGKSRSRVVCRGSRVKCRGWNVEVEGEKSKSRVKCRGSKN